MDPETWVASVNPAIEQHGWPRKTQKYQVAWVASVNPADSEAWRTLADTVASVASEAPVTWVALTDPAGSLS